MKWSPTKVWVDGIASKAAHGDSGSGLVGTVDGTSYLVAIESGSETRGGVLVRFIRLDTSPGQFVRQKMSSF
jgi:hypothetical protein